jgi:hypothetical protein
MNLETILTRLYLALDSLSGGVMFLICLAGIVSVLTLPIFDSTASIKKASKLRWVCHIGFILAAGFIVTGMIVLTTHYQAPPPNGVVFTLNEDGTRTDHPFGRSKAPNVWSYSGIKRTVERDFGPFKISGDADAYATICLEFVLSEPEKYVTAKKLEGGGRIDFEPRLLEFFATPVTARTEALKALLDAGIDVPEDRRLESATAIARATIQEKYLDRRGISVKVTKLQYATYGAE